MTHLATELTVDSAAPVELFTFTIPGTTLAWRYCTDTQPWTFGLNTWVPEAIERSAVSRKLDETSSPMQVMVGDENPFALALLAGLTVRPVAVLVEQFHRTDAGLERIVIFTGNAAGVTFEGAKATITCLPRLAVADRRRVPWQTYQATCNWQWSSPGCGVDREAFKRGPYSLGPTAQVANTLTIPGVHVTGDLSNGWVHRVADGDTRFIEQNIGGELVLEYPFRSISPSSEQFVVYPGCRRTESDCAGRYNNLPNYLGWSRLPAQNPFERSAFYLSTAAPATPPSGSVYDLALDGIPGYTMRAPTGLVNVAGAAGYYQSDPVVYSAAAFSSGYIIGYARDGALAIGGWLEPIPTAPLGGVGTDYEIRWEYLRSVDSVTGTTVAALPFSTSGPLGVWIDLGAGTQVTVAVGIGVAVEFRVSIRLKSTGIIRVQGTFQLNSVGGYDLGGGSSA